jgi:hypothetical protein
VPLIAKSGMRPVVELAAPCIARKTVRKSVAEFFAAAHRRGIPYGVFKMPPYPPRFRFALTLANMARLESLRFGKHQPPSYWPLRFEAPPITARNFLRPAHS